MKERLISFLRSTERYTKTDMVYLTTSGFWVTAGQFAASASSLLLVILFANFLSPAVYGTYDYVLAVISILTLTTLSGINTTLGPGVARGSEGSFLIALREKMRWGLLGLGGGLLVAGYYFLQGNSVLAWALVLAALFVPIMDPFSLFQTFLQGKKDFRASTVYFVVGQLFSTVVVAAAVVLTHNLYVLLLAYFGSWTLARYVAHRVTLRRYSPNTTHDPRIISYGRHLTFAGLLNTIIKYVDDLFIFHFLGPIPVAVYNLATGPLDQIRAWAKNIVPIAVPKLSHRTIFEINTQIYGRLFLLFVIGLVTATAYALLAPYVFTFVFPKYHAAITVTQFYAFTLAFILPGNFLGAAMQSKVHLMPKSWIYWGTIPPLSLVASLVILIPLYGLAGVVMSLYLQLTISTTIGIIQWEMLTARERAQT